MGIYGTYLVMSDSAKFVRSAFDSFPKNCKFVGNSDTEMRNLISDVETRKVHATRVHLSWERQICFVVGSGVVQQVLRRYHVQLDMATQQSRT